MTYATRKDLETRFGADEIAKLADDETVLAAAIADAAAEIDSRLAVAYALPLDGAFPALVPIAADLARRRLYDEAAPEHVTTAASEARERLGEIADGTAALVDSRGDPAPRANAGTTTPGRQTFATGRLAGF
ncbi:MAG: DUF1320 family protein [Defluviicoccus sp.]|nr:DUF1320 family protein [Defluviicoccus sp.]